MATKEKRHPLAFCRLILILVSEPKHLHTPLERIIFEHVPQLKDRITPHVNFFRRIVKEELKCKRERSGRSEMEIELGMSVDVCVCVFVCMCMYVWWGLCV